MIKYKIEILLIITVYLLFPGITWGQQVSGYIEDAGSGERLPYANIYTPDLKYGTASNAFGYFGIKLPGESKSIIVSYTGYEETTIELNNRRDTFLIIKLESSNQLNEVTVTSNRRIYELHSPQMGKIDLSQVQLEKTPAIFGEPDIMKLAQLMPGIQPTKAGFAGLIVRGGKPDQNLILLDGVPVYNSSHLYGLYSVINENAIQSAQIIKGNFPAQYGGRLSSLIDITLKEGNTKKFKGEMSVGMVGGKFALDGPIFDDKTTFCISGRRTLLDIFYQPFIILKDKETNGYFFADLNAKINRRISNKDRLFFSFYYGKDKNYRSNWGEDVEIDDKPYELSSKEGYQWGNYTSSFRWNHIWSPSLFSNSTLIYTDFDMGHYNKRELTDNETDNNYKDDIVYSSGIRDIGFKQDFDFVGLKDQHLKFGGAWINHKFRPGITAVVIDNIIDSTNVNSTVGPEESIFNEINLYINDEWQVLPFLTMSIGGRFVHANIKSKSFTFLEPRISTSLKLLRNLSAKASYSVNNQFLHLIRSSALELPTDLWVPASEKLQPEHARQWAFGTDWAIKPDLFLSFEAYYKTTKNIIEYMEGSSMFTVKNSWEDKVETGTGEAYGGEFLLQKKEGETTGWISYSLAWAYNQFENINGGKRFYSSWDRRHDFAIVLQHRFNDKWDIASNWVFSSGTPFSAPTYRIKGSPKLAGDQKELFLQKNNLRMPAYHRLDFSVNYSIQSKKREGRIHQFSFSVYNLYNRRNVYYMGYFWGRKVKASLFPILPSLSYTFKFGYEK